MVYVNSSTPYMKLFSLKSIDWPSIPGATMTPLCGPSMLSEFLVKEWAEHFLEKTDAELDKIAGSFRFGQCTKGEEVSEILKENASSQAVAN